MSLGIAGAFLFACLACLSRLIPILHPIQNPVLSC
jgi:hypothetical protein